MKIKNTPMILLVFAATVSGAGCAAKTPQSKLSQTPATLNSAADQNAKQEGAMRTKITFSHNGETLAGNLYFPPGFERGERLPAVVVTGSWTSIKEQMAGAYAAKLAEHGYITLAFDFRGWGESESTPQYMEDPQRKTADIVAAAAWLASHPDVDRDKIGGIGICASAGYMSNAALKSDEIKTVTLIAPWLHNGKIVEAVYGGQEGVDSLIEMGRKAKNAREPVIIEAASTTNEKSLMFNAPYYTESDRGLIPEYDNKFNVASWEPWLTFDAIEIASKLKKRTLLVHSQSAAIPQGAELFADQMGPYAKTIWLEEVTQFDFYDQPEPMETAIDAAVNHFGRNL